MSTYWVCSDNIDGKENSRIEALCKALKKAGHTAHNGGVGPNTIQTHGMSSGSKGQIGVFICGGVDIQVFWDFVQGIGRYYHYKRFIYVYASDTATSDKILTCNGAKNWKSTKAWDDNYSGGRGDAIGKTVHQYCSEHKDKIWYACGPKGCKFEEVIQNFLKGEGAGDTTENSSNDKSSSGSASCKESIQKLLKHWDGEVECRIVDNTVYINKIPEPESNYTLLLQEGVNVFSDSVKITDVNPKTINYLVVNWSEGKITIKDTELIKRFGENKKEIDAIKKVNKKVSNTKTDSKNKNNTDTNTDTDTDSDSEEEVIDNSEKTKVEKVPIKKYKEALEFANTEWHKIKRDNGHSIECQVYGAPEWRDGKWVKVVLPSFGENDYMYITRASHSDDGGDWTCNLTLVDYPPGWGTEESSSKSKSKDETDKSKIPDVINKICKEIGKFTYSTSCSDAKRGFISMLLAVVIGIGRLSIIMVLNGLCSHIVNLV